MSCKVSVVCVTNRKGAAEFLKKQLDSQDFRDFEAVIADDSGDANIKVYKHFVPRQKNPGDAWNLNKAYNDALNICEGELIVFIQDFIEIPKWGLSRFWELYKLLPNDLVTGVGHKYDNGKIVEIDDRNIGEKQLIESDWTYYELNWASCPASKLVKFDESMDSMYGGENQVFAFNTRAKVWIDRVNECRGLVHTDRPKDWESRHVNKTSFLNEYINGTESLNKA